MIIVTIMILLKGFTYLIMIPSRKAGTMSIRQFSRASQARLGLPVFLSTVYQLNGISETDLPMALELRMRTVREYTPNMNPKNSTSNTLSCIFLPGIRSIIARKNTTIIHMAIYPELVI